MKELDAKVFPSEENTIIVFTDPIYGGAHRYMIQECLGFIDGKTQYAGTSQTIQFVQKNEDGSLTPGLQDEQLVFMLIDRIEKLNERFPSDSNKTKIEGLKMFIDASEERIKDRMDRGVMGDLKK